MVLLTCELHDGCLQSTCAWHLSTPYPSVGLHGDCSSARRPHSSVALAGKDLRTVLVRLSWLLHS